MRFISDNVASKRPQHTTLCITVVHIFHYSFRNTYLAARQNVINFLAAAMSKCSTARKLVSRLGYSASYSINLIGPK